MPLAPSRQLFEIRSEWLGGNVLPRANTWPAVAPVTRARRCRAAGPA